jgi:hypothetical protein
MSKILLLAFLCLIFTSFMFAQVTLDPLQYVNTQIAADTLADGSHDPAKTVYLAESGQFYAFDGYLDCNFDLVIEGPDDTWIYNQTTPPVFLQVPSGTGAGRDMIHLLDGGSVRIKNVIIDGNMSNDELVGAFVINSGGYKIIFDNCVFGECQWFTTRNQAIADTISYTNCVFVNMVRKASSPFNGMLLRIDAACINFIFENNTSVNSSRLFGNGGNFFTSTMREIHNTYLNMQVNGHELHYYDALQANNIYYNWSYRGRNSETNYYEAPFTTWDHHYEVANKLDSVSIYEGRNSFYLDPAFPEYWENTINPLISEDSKKLIPCFLWPTGVDTTIWEDDNFTVGKNYNSNPMFTNDPSNVAAMLEWDNYHWANTLGFSGITEWPDWRVQLVVEYDAGSQPVLNWPPEFDLSYTNDSLLIAGTDGLPLGDLNWFPDAKTTYLANRDAYIAALKDSMVNATDVYDPLVEGSEYTDPPSPSAIEDFLNGPTEFSLYQNYPNPFNPTTSIAFKLDKADKISMKIYDITGQLVKTVIDNKNYTAGPHIVKIDMSKHSTGVYFTVLNNGSQNLVRKMMLIK